MTDARQAELTPIRERILIAIAEHVDRHGYAPSLAEIARRARLGSTNTVSYHLDWLEEQGYIKRDRNVARSIVLLEEVAL